MVDPPKETDGVTIIDPVATASFVLAVIALIASIASLTWQVASWRMSGARLRVSMRWAIAMPSPTSVVLVAVEAVNRGRQATVIHQMGFLTSANSQLIELTSALNGQTLPAQIDPGSEVTFYFELTRLQRTLVSERITGPLRPFARSGHGTVVGRAIESESVMQFRN